MLRGAQKVPMLHVYTLGRFRIATAVYQRCFKRCYSREVVAESDIILLRKKGDATATPILTKPLLPAGRIQTPRGYINQADVLGKGIRDLVSTNKNVQYRIHRPSLAEYVTLTPRIVTPVYPADANLIVSLLDLHPQVPNGDAEEPPFEIFEAGTGHGALTLHLARAIHGANPRAPPLPRARSATNATSETEVQQAADPSSDPLDVSGMSALSSDIDNSGKAAEDAYDTYLPTRRAIIHTLDTSTRHSMHAQNIVRNFQQGIYYHNIDFHVGIIPEYISSRLEQCQEPFLNHAVLDLPSTHTYLEVVGNALKTNGFVVVFCPSITQVNSCVLVAKEKRLPLLLETVLEIGAGAGVGGREWDVRLVKPRALLKAETQIRQDGVDSDDEIGTGDPKNKVESGEEAEEAKGGWEMVCRPKVGGRVSGGGFLGLFRRMESNQQVSSVQL